MVVNVIKKPFITPKRMNQAIHSQIRLTLLELSHATKAEISQRTDISFPTISKALEQMEQSGEAVMAGIDDSSGGRRPVRYALNAEHRYGLGVYLEKEETVYSVINYRGEAVETLYLPSVLEDGPEAFTAQLQTVVSRYPSIQSAAIGVPGSVKDGTIFFIPAYDKFSQFDPKACCEERFNLQVVVENDMNAAVLGYHDLSGRADDQTLAYLYLGKNGPGAGILINGDVIRGSTFFSGEVSFVPQYDRYNFLEAVRKSRQAQQELGISDELGDDMIDAMSRLVAALVSIINPHAVIFCKEDISCADADKIAVQCAKYVPDTHIPELVISDWKEDYLHGLQRLALHRMMAGL